jgi:cell division protein FtsB
MENTEEYSNTLKTNEAETDGKPKSKKRFLIFGMILIASAVTILYISNLFYVNKLLKDVYDLNKTYNEIINTNEILQARSSQLESPDRIIPYATDRLGMIVSEEAPIIIDQSF